MSVWRTKSYAYRERRDHEIKKSLGCDWLLEPILFSCWNALLSSIETETYDILIKNTQIVDGTGKAAYKGNVAIKGERIVAVGKTKGEAKVVIDGKGLVTCPGFIDPHSHADMTIMKYPLAENLVMQGITTFLGGMCGISLAPRGKDNYFGMKKRMLKLSSIGIHSENF